MAVDHELLAQRAAQEAQEAAVSLDARLAQRAAQEAAGQAGWAEAGAGWAAAAEQRRLRWMDRNPYAVTPPAAGAPAAEEQPSKLLPQSETRQAAATDRHVVGV